MIPVSIIKAIVKLANKQSSLKHVFLPVCIDTSPFGKFLA